jgi:hypothetical protein
VSQLGDHCRAAASAEGLLDRCRFVLAPADQLSAVPDASVDAVTTRSVLIYVKDKAQAMREFFRVLRPGGRASLFEPVNVLMSAADPDLFHGYDVTPVKALAARVQALYAAIQPPGADPMLDFDDRDLVRHAQDAGFSEISLELLVSGSGSAASAWESVPSGLLQGLTCKADVSGQCGGIDGFRESQILLRQVRGRIPTPSTRTLAVRRSLHAVFTRSPQQFLLPGADYSYEMLAHRNSRSDEP